MRTRRSMHGAVPVLATLAASAVTTAAHPAFGQITYKPYIQHGSVGAFGSSDQMVIAWQTAETTPSTAYSVEFESDDGDGGSVAPAGRVVDNYLAADPSLPVPPTATGPRVNYYALLAGLRYDERYSYRVRGPGLPADGFRASFHTRKRGGDFSFLVQGDEGFFPVVPNSNPARIADYEARIVHLMNNTPSIRLPHVRPLPEADLALNCGDNVYNFGAEDSYRDFWFPVWNSDIDSNETGAPFIRKTPFYIVVGNHDIGSTGVNANLLATDTAPTFGGSIGGGNALAYYNNYYYPLNGPTFVDPEFTWNADTVTDNGFFFQYLGKTYTSKAGIEALRASSALADGTRQIDHMSNYSFDSGSGHFLFLDANPHLFDAVLDGAAVYAAAPDAFPSYPSILRKWIVDDLDASKQPWKVVVFHQPAFSSGLATLRNSQMRAVAKLLEDHGVNIVFNGHEHNYQRTFPLRSTDTTASPASPAGPPAVEIDTAFDGRRHTVPDGVLYVVEGAGGNRDFDGDFGPARGSGTGVDQDDSATGTTAVTSTLTVPNGPASWLDTHLTQAEMAPLFAGAGSGPKITARFKAKVFSFAQVVVRDDRMTLFQITEPLLSTSSATAQNPAPFGTDVDGRPLNDPIPDTLLDPTTGAVVSPPATGTSALLDEFTLSRPDLSSRVRATVRGPQVIASGAAVTYSVRIENGSRHGLNGTQVVFVLPDGATFGGTLSDNASVHEGSVVLTVGHLGAGDIATVTVPVTFAAESRSGVAVARAVVRSSTAQSVAAQASFAWRAP